MEVFADQSLFYSANYPDLPGGDHCPLARDGEPIRYCLKCTNVTDVHMHMPIIAILNHNTLLLVMFPAV